MTSPVQHEISMILAKVGDLEDRYWGKTSAYALQVIALCNDLRRDLAEIPRIHETDVAARLDHVERQLARVTEERDDVQERLTRTEASYRSAEETWTYDEPREVRIASFRGRPTSDLPSQGSKGSYGVIFTLGQVEDLAYRLRLAGAADETDIVFCWSKAEAVVSYPEAIVDYTPEKTPVEVEKEIAATPVLRSMGLGKMLMLVLLFSTLIAGGVKMAEAFVAMLGVS